MVEKPKTAHATTDRSKHSIPSFSDHFLGIRIRDGHTRRITLKHTDFDMMLQHAVASTSPAVKQRLQPWVATSSMMLPPSEATHHKLSTS
eukprot:5225835-Amphidinium_carterae.2